MFHLMIPCFHQCDFLSLQSSTYEHSLPTSSEEFSTSFPYHSVQPRQHRGGRRMDLPSDPYSTFPNRRHPHNDRIRIPSNPSVISSGIRSTTSSLEGGRYMSCKNMRNFDEWREPVAAFSILNFRFVLIRMNTLHSEDP